AAFMPAVCGEEATRRSHGPGLLRKGIGCTRNLEAVPLRQMMPSLPLPPPNTAESRSAGEPACPPHLADVCRAGPTPRTPHHPPGLPVPLQRAYFSANTIVFDVPSTKVAGMRAWPSKAGSSSAQLLLLGTLLWSPKTWKFPA